MSVLSDRDLKVAILQYDLVSPLDLPDKQIQPSSIDVRLGDNLRIFRKGAHAFMDTRKENYGATEVEPLIDDVPYMLHPGEFVLGVTYEYISIPDHLVAKLEGKSSLGRIGLMIHSTAGYVDPGWKGPLTMELSNVGPVSITLYKRMWIGQLVVEEMTSPAERPYGSEGLGSKYTDANELPQASRAHMV